MIPLVLAAAVGAAKLNQLSFLDAREKWKSLRSFHATCSKIDLTWCIEHMGADRAFGMSLGDRADLIARFCSLQQKRADCIKQIVTLQGEIPFARLPGGIIAQFKECQILRSRFQELNREIDSDVYRGQLPLLCGAIDPLQERVAHVNCSGSDTTFLTKCATHWFLDHASRFQSRSYRNCIGHLADHQLNALNAQLQLFHTKVVEQIWGKMVRRSEKLVITMALLQASFIGSIPLSIGSMIVAIISKHLQAHGLAQVFFVSSRFFGVASFIAAVATGLAVRSYSKLIEQKQEQMSTIDRVKETMALIIRKIKDRRFQEMVQVGLHALQRREKILHKLGRRIDRVGEQLAEGDLTIEHLKKESAKQVLQLQKQEGKFSESEKKLTDQDKKLIEQEKMIGELIKRLTSLENRG